jgi:hypothetical protein
LAAANIQPESLNPRVVEMDLAPTGHAALGSSSVSAQPVHTYGMWPMAFEVNEGQADAKVDFIARGRGYTLLLTATDVALSLVAPRDGDSRNQVLTDPSSSAALADQAGSKSTALRMKLVGANPHSTMTGLDRLPGKVNYLLGNDSSAWHRDIATYAKAHYRDVYPGVDLVYYGNQRWLEHDFVVAPGTDPRAIKLEFDGTDELIVDAQGDLVLLRADAAVLQLRKPFAYQDSGSIRRTIPAAYVLDGRQVSFHIDAYDTTKPLVIDPVLNYSTRLGGDDAGYAIAVDAAGNVYVTGETSSTRFPVERPLQRTYGGSVDVFVAKLSADGSQLVYSTYLGGGGADVGYGIAVDAAGNACITGDTRSTDFPLQKPWQPKLGGAVDVFVAKLSGDGSRLLYSTYYGGSGGERGQGIACDAAGNAYVAGYTNSTDLPTANPLQPAFAGGNADAFVLKLNPDGMPIYATYLGGGNDRPDYATAVAADTAGNAYVTGFTNSPDFPTAKPLQPFRGPTDVFVTKINPSGSALVYSTHLGGGADDEAMAIAVDAAGSAYVTGQTESPDFPTTADSFRSQCVAIDAKLPIGKICLGGDAFVSKLAPDGSALVYSTFLNGRGFEVGRAIAVDAKGSAYVAGLTASTDFPMVDAMQPTYGGGDYDVIVVKLDPGGAVIYSTYLGGSGADAAYGIAIDPAGDAWVTGYTTSPDFPLRRPLPKSPRTSRGARDAFIAKISDKPEPHHH